MPAARARTSPYATQLAADIEDLRNLGGPDAPVTRDALKRRGWTDALLDTHIDEARALVRTRQEAAHG